MASPAPTPDTAPPVPRRPGRKRDSAAQERILRAGLDVFAADGWRGFSLDSVARAAGIGKSTIYLRYPDRQQLILAIVAAYGWQGAADLPDHGGIEADLADFAHSYAEWLDGPAGLLSIRMAVEARLNPDFAEVIRPHAVRQISQAHRIIHRAKARGDIPRGASSAVLLDAVVGGLVNHTTTAPGKPPYSSPAGRRFVDELVRDVLHGVMPRPA
jgi:AcrR family transcriptional regulator